MSDSLDGSIKEYLGETRRVPQDLIQKAKDLVPGPRSGVVNCPHCGKPIASPKKPSSGDWNLLWLAAAGASFGLSFVFGDFFYQCLVVTVICAFKWIVERRARKTQILIYQALIGESGEASGHRLHRHTTRL